MLACLAIALYFAILIGLSLLEPRYFSGRTIYLLRALFPSWKFFDDVGDHPELYYKTSDGADWLPVLGKPPRRWFHLFSNTEGSYLLACGSLLQQLVADMEESPGFRVPVLEASVSYRLVKSLVEHSLPTGFSGRYKFKIITGSEDLMVSPFYERVP